MIRYLKNSGVYLANLNPNKGSEIGKKRPVIVLTHQSFLDNDISPIFICPLSTQLYDKNQILHVKITARDYLQQDSFAFPEQCRSISMTRLEPTLITSIADKERQEIFSKLDLLIGFKENITNF